MTHRFNITSKPTPPALWLLSLAVRVVALPWCLLRREESACLRCDKDIAGVHRALHLACLNEAHDNPDGDSAEDLMVTYLEMGEEDVNHE